MKKPVVLALLALAAFTTYADAPKADAPAPSANAKKVAKGKYNFPNKWGYMKSA